MGILTVISAFFRSGTVIQSSIEFITKALQNKYVLLAILGLCILWMYDTKVEAEYTAKHAEQQIDALTKSLDGYKESFEALAVHTNKVYQDRREVEREVEEELPEFEDVVEDLGIADLETQIQAQPEVAIKLIDSTTLEIFNDIEDRLNGGEHGN